METLQKIKDFCQNEINEFSVLGYEPSKYQLGYNSAINDIKDIYEEIPDKPNRNTGSFLKPNQKEHADEVFEFLTKKTAGDTTKDCECDKLEADKVELLEALEECNDELHFYSGHTDFVKENESLIQKLKQ